MANMEHDVFAEQSYGKVALRKLREQGQLPEPGTFRLYCAEWLGARPPFEVMKVTGGIFRAAKKGANKGKLSILVPGTSVNCYVTLAEMRKEK